MSRFIPRLLSALFLVSAVACASPTAPAPVRSHVTAPSVGTSFDDVPVDSTCRSGYNVANGKAC